MAGFNSSSLDNIVARIEEVVVTTDDGYERHLTPQEAAQEIAGRRSASTWRARRFARAGATTTP